MLMSAGEQISVALLAMAVAEMGCPVISLLGWQAGFQTDSAYSSARIKRVDGERIRRELSRHRIVIVAGFQGINRHDDITTLGRGGSDTSAVAIAASMHADLCQIYTDVEGVYSADPRKVKNAVKLPDGRLHATVSPMVLPSSCLLADVNDVFNGIMVRGDAIGDVVFYGRGAGKLPTASAVVADVVDEVKHIRARKYLFWEPGRADYVRDYAEQAQAFLVRCTTADPDGLKKQLAAAFGEVTFVDANLGDGTVAFATPAIPERDAVLKFEALTDATVQSRIRIAAM